MTNLCMCIFCDFILKLLKFTFIYYPPLLQYNFISSTVSQYILALKYVYTRERMV